MNSKELVNPEGLSKDISLLTIICCPKSSDGNKLSSWKNVKRGTTVTLGANNDEVQGEVVSVSDFHGELQKLCENAIQEIRDEADSKKVSVKKRIFNKWMAETTLKKESSDSTGMPSATTGVALQQQRFKRTIERIILESGRFNCLLTEFEREILESRLSEVSPQEIQNTPLPCSSSSGSSSSSSSSSSPSSSTSSSSSSSSGSSSSPSSSSSSSSPSSSSSISSSSSSSSSPSSSSPSSSSNSVEIPQPAEQQSVSEMIKIGPNGTEIPKTIYDEINWKNYSSATRKLLMTLFKRDVLATHSLTGKKSPAFLQSDKEAKPQLDPTTVSDIITAVTREAKVPRSIVKSVITTKLSDENKMMRKRLKSYTK